TDLAAGGDVDGARRRAWADAERQARAAGEVAHEPVRFVGADVPRPGREAAAVGLLLADGRRVGGSDVEVQSGRAVAEADLAAGGDEDRVRRRARGDRARHLRAGDVLYGAIARDAARVVGGQLPVVVRAARCRAGVVELDAGVVLLEADRVEAERLVVHAVEADAETALDDLVVRGDDVVRRRVELPGSAGGGVGRHHLRRLAGRGGLGAADDEGAVADRERACLNDRFADSRFRLDLGDGVVIVLRTRGDEALLH